ncbi:MAG: aminotransferase class I/II-fold pyridoxal phosphate-dependent enzyme, partial [Planctomycetota bacterium]
LENPNCVVVRTLSKAYGCAGLRCGYAMGDSGVITTLRAAGNPFSVSGPTVEAAKRRIESGDQDVLAYCERICDERTKLESILRELGCSVVESRANFVFCQTPRAAWVRDALAGMGIAIRGWTGRPGFEESLRITLPGDEKKFARLESALGAALRPEAIIFDMDGVLARVDGSYRAAIIATAGSYGVKINADDIKRAKREGNANDDWQLTHRFVREAGVSATLEQVTERFELLYQGEDGVNGLKQTETLIPRVGLMQEIAGKVRLGVATGRPRRDAEEFVERFGLQEVFETLVCMEDTNRHKPDPEPVREAMKRMYASSAWYVGDTRDDMTAARAAGVPGVAHVAPQDDVDEVTPVLLKAGAGRVVTDLEALLEFLP